MRLSFGRVANTKYE
jgi:hypothetical protein